MTTTKLATSLLLALLALLPLGGGRAAEVEEAPEVIVVIGRLPGPPLWRVSKGENVLWIFPYVQWIPEGMLWDSERVARVIAESQEALSPPEIWWTPSKLVMLNPVNIARNERLNGRIERNADGGTLEENLPPELYARFAALQGRYFPESDYWREVRPAIAGRWMMNVIRRREGLVAGDEILKTVRRLERRNRGLRRTEISVRTIIDSYGEYAARLEAVYASYPPAEEQACFEQQLRHMEEDLDELKSRANSWAQGHIDEFRKVPLAADEAYSHQCVDLWRGSSSPERETMVGMSKRADQLWLDAAENALATNASTFAVLPINELLAEDRLLSKLKAAGYEVKEP
jgi:hypothetical protein